jgi:hypothetical protein
MRPGFLLRRNGRMSLCEPLIAGSFSGIQIFPRFQTR